MAVPTEFETWICIREHPDGEHHICTSSSGPTLDFARYRAKECGEMVNKKYPVVRFHRAKVIFSNETACA